MQRRFELMNFCTSLGRRVITERIIQLKIAMEDQS